MGHYVIRIDGELPPDALRNFADVVAVPGHVQTVLHGELPDQASLAGILDYLDELGVEIVEVLKVPPDGEALHEAGGGR